MSDLYEVAMMVKQAAESEYESDLSKIARKDWSRTGPVKQRAIKAPANYMPALAPQQMEALAPQQMDAIVRQVPRASNAIITSYPAQAEQVANSIITTRPSTLMERVQANGRNLKNDAKAVAESARVGKGYGLRAAGYFAKAHPYATTAAGLATAGLIGGGAYAVTKKEASVAKTAAELMYQEAMEDAEEVNEKIAYAQDLYEEADYAEKTAAESNAIITTRPSTKTELLQAYGRNLKNDAKAVAESAHVGKGYGLRAAQYFVKAHPAAAAAALVGAGALTAGGAYAYSNHAKTAAEELFDEAMYEADEINEKIAFAQQLFDEADYAEKIAEDNGSGTGVSYVASAGYGAGVGAAAGGGLATLQAVMAKQRPDPRFVGAGAAIGAAVGAAAAPLAQAGIAGIGALKAFVDEHRAQRAAQSQQ